MKKYLVTWILPDGNKITKDYVADGISIQPNGLTVFLRHPKVAAFNLTVGAQTETPPDVAGVANGYNAIEVIE